jgi:hypothetical protein
MKYIKDLVLTDNFLIKGHINSGGQRLSTFLNNTLRDFLDIDEVTLIHSVHGGRIATMQMMVRVDEIILAHEIDVAGDEGLRLLAKEERDAIEVAALFGGTTPFQLFGKVSERAIERNRSGRYDFIVVVEPKLRETTDQAGHEFAAFENLSYVIANRNRVAMISRSPMVP